MRWLRSMRLSSGDDPADPFVVTHSQIHYEESFLKDIILNLLGLTIIYLFLTIPLLGMNLKLIAPRMGSV